MTDPIPQPVLDPEHSTYHPSLGDVWSRINRQSDKISEIQATQVRTDEKVAGVVSSIHTLIDAVNELRTIVHKPGPQTNWFAIISTVSGLILGAGGVVATFVLLMVGHLKDADAQQNEVMMRILNRVEKTELETRDNRDLIHDVDKELAYLLGRHELLVDQVQHIDNIGSRYRQNRQSVDE